MELDLFVRASDEQFHREFENGIADPANWPEDTPMDSVRNNDVKMTKKLSILSSCKKRNR